MILSAVDVFSGCGGLSAGIEKAEFSVRAAVENNENAAGVYLLNHPSTHQFTDVTELTAERMIKSIGLVRGGLDLFACCPPCQGFSRVRVRNKGRCANDDRNELIFESLRLIKDCLPKTVLLENVPLLARHWRFRDFISALRGLGYHIDYRIVDAADYGVPQRRKRLVLMASRLGPVKIPDRIYKRRTVRDTIGSLDEPTKSKIPLHQLVGKHSDVVMNRIRRISHDGGGRMDLGDADQLDCHKRRGNNGFRDIYGRMRWDDVSPTLTRFCCNPSKGRFLHPEQDRAITPYEAALLQSFPHSYKFSVELGRGAICSMIGEAFPPLMGWRQAEYLRKHIESYS